MIGKGEYQWSENLPRGTLLNLYLRRAYDRSLLHRAPISSAQYPFHPRAPHNRTSRSSYAWEYRPRAQRRPPTPDYPYAFNRATGPKPSPNNNSSNDSGQAFRHAMRPEVLVGARRETEEMDRQIDRLRGELPFFRAFQVTTLLFLAAAVFGGFGQ